MTDNTDFAALYRELGIDAASSLDDVRKAWRRRVARLHPDQGGGVEDTGRLQELNRLYDAAVDFHARFGRLPGAAPAGAGAFSERSPAGARVDLDVREPAGFGRIARRRVAASLILAVLVAAALTGIAVFAGRSDDSVGTGASSAPVAEANAGSGEHAPAPPPFAPTVVAPGMDKANVRQILGEPLEQHELHWSYGPSWVEFHCDRVIGWYSSPQQPLRVLDALEAYAEPVADNAPCD